MAKAAVRAGFDYAEGSVTDVLMPRQPDDAFRKSLAEWRMVGVPVPVVNSFIPRELRITGPEVDFAALETYVATSMARAEEAGVGIIVFGSGGARRIPDGFDRSAAHQQIVNFCRMTARHARKHGVTVVVEPLNLAECNVLNTVSECAALVNEIDDPAIRLLADAYHMLRDGDSNDSIVEHRSLLVHTHIATIPNRLVPGAEECDFSGFFNALSKAGYRGMLSIEAGAGMIANPDTDLPGALSFMKQLVK